MHEIGSFLDYINGYTSNLFQLGRMCDIILQREAATTNFQLRLSTNDSGFSINQKR